MYGRPDFLSSFEACGRFLSEDSANRLSLPNLEFAVIIQHQGRPWFIFLYGFREIQENLISKARLAFYHVVFLSSK